MENTTLTRYQLARKFIYTVNVALLICWYLTVPVSVMVQSLYYGSGHFQLVWWMALFSPAALLLCWPLMPVLAKAMAGAQHDQPVASARDLRSLLLPGAGIILFLHSLMYLGFNGAYLRDMLNLMYGTEGYMRENFWIEGQTPGTLKIITGFGMALTQSVLLLVIGLFIVAFSYFRSREKAVSGVAGTSETTSTLTRLQIASGFIYVSCFAVFARWLFALSLDVVQNLENGTAFLTTYNGVVVLFVGLILVLLPFVSIVAHATTGDSHSEPVMDVSQLGALIVPCIGLLAFMCLWCQLPKEVAVANWWPGNYPYDIKGWDQSHFIVPVIKSSLPLSLLFYPSIRDMVRQTMKRTT